MGLKFLRDGVDSGNLVSMFEVAGQPGNWNFFGNDFSNHISPASGPLVALGAKFATYTSFIQYVGLSDMAMYSETGASNPQPVFPWSLRFAPSNDVRNLFPNE